MKIILASQSPRRKKLLQQLNLAFEIYPSTLEELSDKKIPEEIVQDLAEQKAADVAQKFPNSLILGSDTIVVHNDKVLGKPSDETEAFEILSELSANRHSVFTGVCLIQTNSKAQIIQNIQFYEETFVYFSTLKPNQIRNYIRTVKPFDKAGSYGIQDDLGAVFVEKIEGDFYNVVGLPLNRLYREFQINFPNLLN